MGYVVGYENARRGNGGFNAPQGSRCRFKNKAKALDFIENNVQAVELYRSSVDKFSFRHVRWVISLKDDIEVSDVYITRVNDRAMAFSLKQVLNDICEPDCARVLGDCGGILEKPVSIPKIDCHCWHGHKGWTRQCLDVPKLIVAYKNGHLGLKTAGQHADRPLLTKAARSITSN